jgi:hypothetical protein
MDDDDSLDQEMSDLVGSSTLMAADEDRTYGLIVNRARNRIRRRRVATAAVTMAIFVTIGINVVSGERHTAEVRVQGPSSSVPSTTARAAASDSSRNAIPKSALQEMQAALRAWSAFPVTASPRPLVLTSDPVSAPARGFSTNDAKEAFLTGVFTAPAAFPAGPQRADGYPVVTAEEALAVLRAEGTPASGAPRPPTPLVITTIRFGTASFGTDRGTRLLPAWLFSFAGVQDPGSVLAVAPSFRFAAPAESIGGASVGARLGPDGRTATIMFTGAAPGSGRCTADYTVDQLASDTAVAIRVRETRSSSGLCSSLGYGRQQNLVLASPLGGRVLVDAATKGPVAIAP